MTTDDVWLVAQYQSILNSQFKRWLFEDGDSLAKQKIDSAVRFFSGVTVDQAKAACEAIKCGSAVLRNPYDNNHFADIARVARDIYREQDRRYIDPPGREETFRCGYCRDAKAPYVAVYGRKFVQWFGRQNPPPVNESDEGDVWFDSEDPRWLSEKTRELRYALNGVAVRCVCRPYPEGKEGKPRMLNPDVDVVCLYPDVANLVSSLERTPAWM